MKTLSFNLGNSRNPFLKALLRFLLSLSEGASKDKVQDMIRNSNMKRKGSLFLRPLWNNMQKAQDMKFISHFVPCSFIK